MSPTDLPRLTGRSSSLFTRVPRIFAAAAGADYAFEVVRDLLSAQTADYADNPALKLPTLRTVEGLWFGALNISRVLVRAAPRQLALVWPEDLRTPVAANAMELTQQAMATEVSLIMGSLAGRGDDPHQLKMRASLGNSLAWLDAHVDAALAALPSRDLSYLEASLYCLVTHLAFREVMDVAPYARLNAFCASFGERAEAAQTAYRFDA